MAPYRTTGTILYTSLVWYHIIYIYINSVAQKVIDERHCFYRFNDERIVSAWILPSCTCSGCRIVVCILPLVSVCSQNEIVFPLPRIFVCLDGEGS